MRQSSSIESEQKQNNCHHLTVNNTSLVSQPFVDNRESTAQMRQLMVTIENSPQTIAQRKLSEQINHSPHIIVQRRQMARKTGDAVQRVEGEDELMQRKFSTIQFVQTPEEKKNNTGLPDNLKSGIENLSGMSMDHVKVHYNSSEPAQLKAHAYAQGTDIYVAPGQEQYLPHESWHVVQQAQGRVKPTLQMKNGIFANDDQRLEREADLMGTRAEAGVVQTREEVGGSIESDSNGSTANKQRLSNGSVREIVQCYSEEANNFSVSINRQFAVQNEGKDGKLFILSGTNLPALQHVELNEAGSQLVNGTDMVEVTADFENEAAMNEMYCGKFSKSVSGITEIEENENAPVGRSLYTNDVTSDNEDVTGGWANHYAPVILTDAGDRATVETAVGIPYWWFGIYGSARGQTFRFKTQYANIIRSMANEWVDEETGQLILQELTKYKNNAIENDEELHEYTLKEVIKLRAMALAPPIVLGRQDAVETENPLTKQESDEKTLREMRERESRERNNLILKSVLGLGAAALTIIAGYYWLNKKT